ncbi:hypothetical protein MPTK1_6g16010 [Marchantia polymorpha subsp. ruderalis]|uniref:EF-hand domain-containing protein n=2 Tax=Marchantia polymorpha TaxID=3197 RepID=A0AAF6BSJ8_MARPO|nr:hypothetical protein MARPO_0056s0113 [Marchantia polymorpha]BBN14982.1 hypothetical protein Mp_6g16010 [Marchantia polymorpha subsp. ruderalis]|eukprot:PTQ37666.1 hypothetical protein MARPO_0056s0113 [Marchantia polymorpha]
MGNIINVAREKGEFIDIIRQKDAILSGTEAWRAKQRFKKVVDDGADGIAPEQFKTLLGPSGEPCAEVLFKHVDTDNNGSVSYQEICEEIKTHRSMTTPEAKVLVLFKLYDQDHDGRMSPSELARAMQLACQALPQGQLDQLVQAIMEVFDSDKDGYLNFGEFSALMSNSGLELNV